MQVNVHEAKSQLSRLLELVEEGETVIIARHGEPVAELVPSRKGFPFGIAREEPLPTLAIRIRHIRKLAGLRELHTYPIDRIFVAQALAEGLTLGTKDAMLERYGAPVVWE